MIQDLNIVHFRGLRDLKLKGLGRITLITGGNGVGKTSVLEALALVHASANPTPYLRQAELRGLGFDTPWAFENAIRWLFSARSTTEPVRVEVRDRKLGKLKFELRESDSQANPTEGLFKNVENRSGSGRSSISESGIQGSAQFDTILAIDDNEPILGVIKVSADQPEWTVAKGGGSQPIKASCYINPNLARAHENAQRLSQLIREDRVSPLIECLKSIEPNLQTVQPLSQQGRMAVEAKIVGMGFVPVGLLGGGFEKALNLLLAIMTSGSGLVLVDEVESGLHPTRLPDVWKAIVAAVLLLDVQVVATTHSQEACAAALASAEAESHDPRSSLGGPVLLRQFRLARGELDGEVVAVAQDQEELQASLQLGLDVR